MTPRSLAIDPDIRKAATLPSWVYHDPGVFTDQAEAVFAPTWQFVGQVQEVKAPGHVRPLTLLPGCLDEPLVLSRDGEGGLHCLSNTCTHRGALVVEGEGHVRGLRCRYHGRRFGLDGRFQSMPEFEDVEGFPSADDDLPRLQLREWGPLLFSRLAPGVDFDRWIAPVRERCDWMPLADARFDAAGSTDYTMDANWALYCDNYLEEFHIPYVHGASLSGQLDYDAYRTEVFEYGNLQFGIARPGEPAFRLPEGHPDQDERVAAFYFWLFPNLMLNFYPWGLSVNVVRPLGPTRTRVSFLYFVLDADRRNEGVGADLHRVEMEDEEIMASTQRGVRSRLYERGRYSPRREVGTHHFHALLASFMAGSTEPVRLVRSD